MVRGLRSRSARSLLALCATATATAVLTSGCGTQDSYGLAKQACVYVNTSISQWDSSVKKGTSTSLKKHLQSEAYDNLQLALQPAALAAGDNGQWQALMTTISESSRVPENVLIPALTDQCGVADSK